MPDIPPLPEDRGFWSPDWREQWEELDGETRRRIRRTVQAGQPLDDARDASFAVTLAVRSRREHRKAVPLHLVGLAFGGLLVWSLLRGDLTPDPLGWLVVLLWGVWAVAFPVWHLVLDRRLRRAEALNREVVRPSGGDAP